jgi:NADH-quinone oxidoreductase subunit F
MDLHVVAPLPSAAERAAVDALLDPLIGPADTWSGGARAIGADGRAARGGRAARERRDLLLPALHALMDRVGWISPPGLGYVARRLTVPPAEAYGVATFYALFATNERPAAVVHACDDIACRPLGAETLCADLERRLGPEGQPRPGAAATWFRSPCLGQCERGPAALVTMAGERPSSTVVAPADAAAIGAALEGRPPAPAPLDRSLPQLGTPGRRLTVRIGVVDPASLDDYRAHGGYPALARALAIGPAATIAEVGASGLVGRGGAAFPTGRKWAAVAAQPARPRYVVCNADESEPGTFKDRVLMEGDPYALVEAMTIEGVAVGAETGYLYLRGEYPLAESRLNHAIATAEAAGLLGDDVMGSGLRFRIELRRGAGAYICGEETALLGSIEGRRGEPRNKPPFPVEVGLFGKPTAINNVETLLNVPLILADEGGAAAFAAIGTAASSGPKLFCLSGSVARPGVYEVDFGMTLRELIDLAGGIADGRRLRTVLLGGAAGVFVGPDALDMPLTLEGARAAGATLGSGVVMVFDETADIPGTLRRIAAFFRDESCGQCVPCRVGTVRQEELLARLGARLEAGGAPDAAQLALLRELGQAMRDASICGLGQTASSAVETALRIPGLVSA